MKKSFKILLGVALVILVAYAYMKNKEVEKFKVLGSLANQRELYYKCLSDCERSDPGKTLLPTKGNFSCMKYCESTISDLVRRGGPSYPVDIPVETVPVFTRIDSSYSKCGDGTQGDWCRGQYASTGQIDELCRQNCEYSTSNTCMTDCSNVLRVNKSSGSWSWK